MNEPTMPATWDRSPTRSKVAHALIRRMFFRPLYLAMAHPSGATVQFETRSFRQLMQVYYLNRAEGYR